MSTRSSMTDEICIVCRESLQLQIESDDGEEAASTSMAHESFVYDDVELLCGHHIHYDCARDLHAQSKSAITQCPACDASLLSGGRLLVTIRNEGGTTSDFDLGTDLEEQQQLQADPELARNEAFLSFCFSEDHEAMQEVLRNGADVNAVQRGTGMTGLHLCALNNDAPGISILVQAGAMRERKGLDGSTALDLAIGEGSHDAAYALQQ